MLELPAVLTHAAATEFFYTVGKNVPSLPEQVVVDATALRQFDSSALAILLECRRQAMAEGKTFAVSGAPDRLLQLAGVYGLASLIPVAESAGSGAA